jgi:hypothetical protein
MSRELPAQAVVQLQGCLTAASIVLRRRNSTCNLASGLAKRANISCFCTVLQNPALR